MSQRPTLPLPVHLATYPSADVLLPPSQTIPTHQLAASGDSPTQGAPSHPLQPAVGEEAVQATAPVQSHEEDFQEVIYYLPHGAHLHPGETEGSVMVDWGELRYYGFKRVSVNPPAFILTQKDQLLIYDSFLLECSMSPPESTDPASKALLRGSELLFKMETVYNLGLRLGVKPAQLTSATPFPYITNRVLPLFTASQRRYF